MGLAFYICDHLSLQQPGSGWSWSTRSTGLYWCGDGPPCPRCSPNGRCAPRPKTVRGPTARLPHSSRTTRRQGGRGLCWCGDGPPCPRTPCEASRCSPSGRCAPPPLNTVRGPTARRPQSCAPGRPRTMRRCQGRARGADGQRGREEPDCLGLTGRDCCSVRTSVQTSVLEKAVRDGSSTLPTAQRGTTRDGQHVNGPAGCMGRATTDARGQGVVRPSRNVVVAVVDDEALDQVPVVVEDDDRDVRVNAHECRELLGRDLRTVSGCWRLDYAGDTG